VAYDVRFRGPGGVVGFLRMSGKRPPVCGCGCIATRECDWKIKSSDAAPAPRAAKSKLGRTCDAPLCDVCTWSPAPDKDLCPAHAKQWRAYLERRSEAEKEKT
jgi:hypothetical protein